MLGDDVAPNRSRVYSLSVIPDTIAIGLESLDNIKGLVLVFVRVADKDVGFVTLVWPLHSVRAHPDCSLNIPTKPIP